MADESVSLPVASLTHRQISEATLRILMDERGALTAENAHLRAALTEAAAAVRRNTDRIVAAAGTLTPTDQEGPLP